jgi:4-hydroxybenzoate polyprenyltransferase
VSQLPLVVDLDGTLVNTDTLHESTLALFRQNPLSILAIPGWLCKGKAYFKQIIATKVSLNPAYLPYNSALLDWLKIQRQAGRPLVLCTAADSSIAKTIASHLNIFEEVIASDGKHNVAGANKANLLVDKYGESGFDYAGNASVDLHVWAKARRAVVVNGSESLIKKAKSVCEIEHVISKPKFGLNMLRRTLRAHQWMKNLLLFVPAVAAHLVSDTSVWITLFLAFMAFSICASSVYIANDLMDLDSDRQHPHKSHRPFASGAVPIWLGVVLASILLVSSLLLAKKVGTDFLGWLIFYFALTTLYTMGLKKVVLIDCITLAMLYTLRIVAGNAVIQTEMAYWLLAFAVFIFFSLAFVKRYAELVVQQQYGKTTAIGRGYHTDDIGIIQSMGIASGYVAVLVLALYLNGDTVSILYRFPQAIWAAVPVIMFWVSWMWMQAHRGNMHDDPLVYAVKDKTSLAAGALFVLIMAVGTVGWRW